MNREMEKRVVLVRVMYTKKFVAGKFAGIVINESMRMHVSRLNAFLEKAGNRLVDLTGNKYVIGNITLASV